MGWIRIGLSALIAFRRIVANTFKYIVTYDVETTSASASPHVAFPHIKTFKMWGLAIFKFPILCCPLKVSSLGLHSLAYVPRGLGDWAEWDWAHVKSWIGTYHRIDRGENNIWPMLCRNDRRL